MESIQKFLIGLSFDQIKKARLKKIKNILASNGIIYILQPTSAEKVCKLGAWINTPFWNKPLEITFVKKIKTKNNNIKLKVGLETT